MKIAALSLIALASVQGAHSASELVSKAYALAEEGSMMQVHLGAALSTMGAAKGADARAQTVSVPIDEKRALTVKVSPTYALDDINSVTLKSFRKIVGYDTFESIRRKNRNESKDTSDYYNVTVSMMVRRKPAEVASSPARDPYNPDGAAALASTLDKGFPYDD